MTISTPKQLGQDLVNESAKKFPDSKRIFSLIEQGAALNETDWEGNTALIWAAFRGHTEIVQALVDAGARLDEKDTEGYTPLDWSRKRQGETAGRIKDGIAGPFESFLLECHVAVAEILQTATEREQEQHRRYEEDLEKMALRQPIKPPPPIRLRRKGNTP